MCPNITKTCNMKFLFSLGVCVSVCVWLENGFAYSVCHDMHCNHETEYTLV